MKRINMFLLIILLFSSTAFALTAQEIIDRVDENSIASNQFFNGRMEINKGKRTLIKEFVGYGQDNEESFFMEFTNAEDVGVKYLKIADELWIYFPDADDIMKISGSMLKQGMMGSDLSYEDMVRMEDLSEKYDVELLEEEEYDGVECYKIQLTAKPDVKDVTYYREIMWVEKDKFVMRKVELYAKSGRLLKEMLVEKVIQVGKRYFGSKIIITDKKKKNSITTMEFTEVKFDVKLPEGIFTREYLKR
ncbi:outer membrane lipoprotein-sorting protein [bacterium]|nr:outer membrane lipoprotein-sorting protein [bacterium]